MNKQPLALIAIGSALFSPLSMADFIKDSKATLGMRNYYFNNDNRDGAANPSRTEEWAQGFMLNYQSGFTEGTVGFGVDALGLLGIRLDSGDGRHVGSSMIPNDGNGAAGQWSRFGATAKMRFAQTEMRYGTLTPKLPILQANDGRLLPQTFEGGQIVSNDFEHLTLTGGHLEHATGRGSSDSTGLAVAGGTRESNAFNFAGADYKVTDALLAQYYYANLEDYYQQHFAGLVHNLKLGDFGALKTDLRYFKTSADGANDSAAGRANGYRTSGYTQNGDGKIDNNTWSLAFTWSIGAHALMAGYQQVSSDSGFVQLNQGGLPDKGAAGASVYLLTDRYIQNFTRAGERTGFAQYTYDFAALGLPGLKASAMYLSGSGIKTVAGPEQEEWERDLSLDYVIQSGPLKNVALGWRNGMSRSEASRDADQNRLVVSYSLPLF
jgi:hypothetical protein